MAAGRLGEIPQDDAERPAIAACVVTRQDEFVASIVVLYDHQSEHDVAKLESALPSGMSQFLDCSLRHRPSTMSGGLTRAGADASTEKNVPMPLDGTETKVVRVLRCASQTACQARSIRSLSRDLSRWSVTLVM